MSWNSSDGQTLTGVSLETEEQGDSALKDIRNRVTLTVGAGLQVTCSLLNPAPQTETHKVLTITGDFLPDVSPWLPAFFVVFPLVVMAAGVTGYLFKCRRDSIKEKEHQTRRAEREPLMQQDEYAELKKELSGARAVSKSEWKRIQNKRNGSVSLSPGSEGPELSSGNHYWEVNLTDVAKWRVGVKDKGAVLRNDSPRDGGVVSLLQPRDGVPRPAPSRFSHQPEQAAQVCRSPAGLQ
ncbi:hypothetical protein AGOR_G00132310 [Albula goreensis]|uniref:Uncharacterized protein n=1 Tax=Albula goreensis TaxID=1534307 RepID=A0A8T3D7R6_9TELE|nr:hypothetical protein AGOR_G00132310 [Albula goreensis]